MMGACGAATETPTAQPDGSGTEVSELVDSGAPPTRQDGQSQADVDAGPSASCQWVKAVEVGKLNDPRLPELSGLAASRARPGWLWGHNDSGEEVARLLLIDETAQVRGELRMPEEEVIDWEDIAAGPCQGGRPETSCLWIGDIGDNSHKRSELRVLRVSEPQIEAGDGPFSWETTATRYLFRYPSTGEGGPESKAPDAEAMVVLPDATLWVLTKQNDGRSRVFHVKPQADKTVVATLLTTLDLRDDKLRRGLSLRATAADLRGGQLVVRTYFRAWAFDVTPWLKGDFISPTRTPVPAGFDVQGEALAIGLDGDIWHSSEGLDQPLWHLSCSAP